MLTFDAAKAQLLASARVPDETETLDLADAFERVLAADLVSPLDVPPFANAAMDGYAIRTTEVTEAGTHLRVSQRVAAGDVARPLEPGTAARVFTGAQIPDGADAVVMQEDCQAADGFVSVDRVSAAGEYVRARGAHLSAGQVFLAAGSVLSAAAMGLAASVGIASVAVFKRLKVAIFSTGNELVEPGAPLPPGHIYNSNRYLMRGFLQGLGVEVVDLGIVRDGLQATREALREAAARAQVVITSGGMSVGEEDHVVAAVREVGRIAVWKIAAKPGKPLAFGAVGTAGREAVFIGLPGNPVSAWSSLLTLVAPFLRRAQGLSRLEQEPVLMRVDSHYTVLGDRMEFVRARRNGAGGLDIYPTQDSAVIASAAWADGVVPLDAGASVRPGDVVRFMPGPAWRP